MSEKRFIFATNEKRFNLDDESRIWDNGTPMTALDIVMMLNEQQDTIEHLTKSRDKWSQSAKLHSEYFNCLEKAIERAYEEKPYPKIDDIMNIYSKLEKEIDDE